MDDAQTGWPALPDVFGCFQDRLRRRWERLHRVTEEQRNERLMYAQMAIQGLLSGGGLAFVSVFLVRLGAPNWLIGLYTSLPALVMMLAVLPAGSLVQRRRNAAQTLSWARILFRGAMGCFGFLPWFPAAVAPYLMVGLRTAGALPHAVLNVSLTTLLGKVTTAERRAQMLSTRLAINRLMMAGVALVAGFWLEAVAYPLNYQVLFWLFFASALGSAAIYSRLRVPEAAEETLQERQRLDLRSVLPLIKKTPAFRNFLLAALVFRMGIYIPMALFPIYRVRVLGSSDAWIGTLMTVQRFLQMPIFFGLGSILRRRRYRRWLWLACLGMGFFPLTTALSTTPTMLLIPAVVAGLMGPGMSIFLSNTLLHVSPEGQRPIFVAINTFVVQMMAFVGPLLGTVLADTIGIRTTLVLGGLLRIVGGLVFWRLGVGRRA